MTPEHDILQVTPRVEALAALCRSNSRIDPALYRKYDVKRGLRDINGQGVLAGLTNISDIISRKEIGGEIVPCEGELYYRGIRRASSVTAARVMRRLPICCCSVSCRMPSVWAISRLCWRRDARCRPISPVMSS